MERYEEMGQSGKEGNTFFIMVRSLILLNGKEQDIEEIQALDLTTWKILERLL